MKTPSRKDRQVEKNSLFAAVVSANWEINVAAKTTPRRVSADNLPDLRNAAAVREYTLARMPLSLRPRAEKMQLVYDQDLKVPTSFKAPSTIVLGGEFFAPNADTRAQQEALARELGREFVWLSNEADATALRTAMKEAAIDPFISSQFPYAAPTADEAFAHCFAVYHLRPQELQARYPTWYSFVNSIVSPH